MKRLLTLCLGFVSIAEMACASSSVDFTPISQVVREDGATRRLVFFRSAPTGMHRLSLVQYAPPWPVVGHCESASMSVPGKDASVLIKSVETEEPLCLEDEACVVEWITKSLPKGAERVHVERVTRDPVRLNGQPTIEVTVSYAYFGRSLQESFFLCHRRGIRPCEVFVFQVTAKPANFKEVHDVFQASLNSIVGF